MCIDDNAHRGGITYRYLPVLSFLLVLVSLGMLLKIYVNSPSDTREQRIAAFSQALKEIPDRYVEEISPTTLYHGAMRGMAAELKDPYSAYITPHEIENTRAQQEGKFGGIGVTVAPRNGGAVVLDVHNRGPAEQAGINPGDVITGVDGRRASTMPFMQFLSFIRGKVGTQVQLMLQDVDTGEEHSVEVTRDRIEIKSVSWERIDDSICSIQIKQFSRGTADRLRDILKKAQSEGNVEAVLIDVRGNAGGLLQEAVSVCDMFLDSGIIAQLSSWNRKEQETFKADPRTVIPMDVPLAVLVDHRSASASEVFAGAMQVLERAAIIGAKTYGKGAVNQILPLPDGSGLILTVAEYLVGGKVRIEDKGVQPDEPVGTIQPPPNSLSREEGQKWLAKYRATHQEQYEAAVNYLKKRIQSRKQPGEEDRD